MSREVIEQAFWNRIQNPSNLEGLCITIFHKGKVFGVDIHPDATEDLLKLEIDTPEGKGIPLHNFIQQYLTPALWHLKRNLEDSDATP